MCKYTNVLKVQKNILHRVLWCLVHCENSRRRPLGHDVIGMIVFFLKSGHSHAVTYKTRIRLEIISSSIISWHHFSIHNGSTTWRRRSSSVTERTLYHMCGTLSPAIRAKIVSVWKENNRPETQKQRKKEFGGRLCRPPHRRVLRTSLAQKKQEANWCKTGESIRDRSHSSTQLDSGIVPISLYIEQSSRYFLHMVRSGVY